VHNSYILRLSREKVITREGLKTISNVGFIFDLDGTLLDSASQIVAAVLEARSFFNMPVVDADEILLLIGRPAIELFKSEDSSEPMDITVLKYFRKILEDKYMNENKIYPFAESLIQKLIRNEFLVGIATSKPTYLAVKAINGSVLNKYPMKIQGTDDFPPKPSPDVVLKCIERLGTKLNFMVGDRTEDMIAGKLAGCTVIGLEQGSHDKMKLTNAGADFVFSGIQELSAELDSVLKRF
jgi:phosphoglycolate phosphatase